MILIAADLTNEERRAVVGQIATRSGAPAPAAEGFVDLAAPNAKAAKRHKDRRKS